MVAQGFSPHPFRQQRTENPERADLRIDRHSGEPRRGRTAKQPQQNGFGLIIGVMGENGRAFGDPGAQREAKCQDGAI
jgi:hypothetical protein